MGNEDGRSPSGPGLRPFGPETQDASQAEPLVPNAERRFDLESISAWPERRPPRAERERSAIAERFASHLPNKRMVRVIGEDDILAMRAAFIRRFDEQLPRTETLMAVAHIGYRMALRDLASVDRSPEGGNHEDGCHAKHESAVAASETPNLSPQGHSHD